MLCLYSILISNPMLNHTFRHVPVVCSNKAELDYLDNGLPSFLSFILHSRKQSAEKMLFPVEKKYSPLRGGWDCEISTHMQGFSQNISASKTRAL